jgi:hypothetical protein
VRQPAHGNPGKIVEQRPYRLLHRAADVLEINVDAVGTCGFELFCKIGRAMIDTGIKAELFGYEPALLGTAGDSNRPASCDLADLSDHRSDCA